MENKVISDRPAAGQADLSPEIAEVANKYGFEALCGSIGKGLRLRQSKQKIMKTHYNSVARVTGVDAPLAAKTVLAVLLAVALKRDRKDLILDSKEASVALLDKKLIGKPITPGTITTLVSGRPEVTRLPKARWAFLRRQSKLGLSLDWYVLWVLAAINRLPSELLSDREEEDTVDAVEPITHRHHLKQVINLVHDALERGLHVLYDLVMMDGTGRFHTVSRLSHQGPGGLRCLHTAPTEEAVNLDHMRLIAYQLQEEYGISYKDVPKLLGREGREALAKAGVSLNSFGDMYKFMKAARTGKSDFLFEGDMNLSLGSIKGLIVGCTDSLTNLGMLKGWLCPNTWNKITAAAKKKASWMKRLANPRKRVKVGGTPLGYSAAVPTAGIAIAGLSGLRINKEVVLHSTTDLLVPQEGVPQEKWGTIEYTLIEDELNEDAKSAMIAEASADPDFCRSPFGTGMVQYYADQGAQAVKDGMNEVLPCLETFDDLFIPKRKTVDHSRSIIGGCGFEAIIPSYELSDEKIDIKSMVAGRSRKTRFLKPKDKGSLAHGPYTVFLIESGGVFRLDEKLSSVYMKFIQDAVLCSVQDTRKVCRAHGHAIIDAVEAFDVSSKDIDLNARKKVLDRCRKEANVWGLPSEKDLERMFPDMEQWLAAYAPSIWVAPVPRDKAIVLHTS